MGVEYRYVETDGHHPAGNTYNCVSKNLLSSLQLSVLRRVCASCNSYYNLIRGFDGSCCWLPVYTHGPEQQMCPGRWIAGEKWTKGTKNLIGLKCSLLSPTFELGPFAVQ